MSTKTTFKRIALVAVAALGFGMLSAVSSSAAITAPTGAGSAVFTPDYNGTHSGAANGNYIVTQTAGASNFVAFTASNEVVSSGTMQSVSLDVTGGTVRSGSSATATCSAPTNLANLGGSSTRATYSAGAWTSGADLLGDSASAPYNLSANCATTFGTGSALTISAAKFTIGTPTAGTIVVKVNGSEVLNGVVTTTLLQTFTIIVSGSSSTSYGKTTVDVTSLGGGTTFDGAGTAYSSKTAGTKVVGFYAKQLNNLGGDLATASSKEVTATITGVGSFSSTVFSSLIVVPAGTWDNSNTVEDLAVYADGRAGTGTLTVKVGGATVATQDFVFYGSKVASLTAVGIYTVARTGGNKSGSLNGEAADCNASGVPTTPVSITTTSNSLVCPGATNQPAIALVAKDADGMIIPVAPAAITMTSSDQTVVQSGITDAFIDNGQSLYSAGWGYIHTTQTSAVGSTSGSKASLTYSYVNTDGTIITSSPVAVTLGGSAAKEVMSLDNNGEYQPGAPFRLTLTATDSAGNPVYDGAAIPSDLSATKALQGAALPTTGVYVGGKYTFKADKYFVPATVGSFTINATSTNLAGDALSVSGKVVLDEAIQTLLNASADAAAEATDAANAATDAANAAAEAADAATAAAQDAADAVAALSAQVATMMAQLKAQLTALTNLVIKIQRKVKA